jgi:type II secretory pathway component PulK
MVMKKSNRKKSGFALFSVLFLIAAISVMLGMLVQIGGQRAFTAKRLTNKVKALAYAEAGIDYAYSVLSVDFDQRNNLSAFELDSSVLISV